MNMQAHLLVFLSSLAVFCLLGSTPGRAQAYAGDYTHPDRTSLRVVTRGDVVHLTFYKANKTVSSKGVGLVLGGKLYFYFKRLSRTGRRGGSGVYVLRGRQMKATHYHLDGKVRWKGVWRKTR